MSFGTAAFFAFATIVLVAYRLSPRSLRPAVLLAASYAFYVSVLPWHAALLFVLTVAVHQASVRLGRAVTAGDDRMARRWLAGGIIGLVAVLAGFKYVGMGVGTLNAALSLFGEGALSAPTYLAPLGLSYVTFGLIHALVAIRRGEASVLRLSDFALFVAFFPTIVAGPIKRYPQFVSDLGLAGSGQGVSDATHGLARILVGLFKKLVLAAIALPLAAPLIEYAAEHPLKLMLGVYAYAFYLYWDFAGYSDMAIGAARLFGFDIIENFDRPYLKRNLSQFWRSWHISLTRIVTEYVYIPLGGNRRGFARTALNSVVAMLVVGIWHGAAWHFVAWGAWHGVGLVLLRAWRGIADALKERVAWLGRAAESRIGAALGYAFGLAVTFNYVALGWVLFVLPVGEAFDFYGQLLRYAGGLVGIG